MCWWCENTVVHYKERQGLRDPKVSVWVGLGWGPSLCIFTSSQVRLMLLVWKSDLENYHSNFLLLMCGVRNSSINLPWNVFRNAEFQNSPDLLDHNLHFTKICCTQMRSSGLIGFSLRLYVSITWGDIKTYMLDSFPKKAFIYLI